MIAVINASPLIYLGKIGAITLLPKLFSMCYTTTIVKKEVLGYETVPEFLILEDCFSDWLTVKNPSSKQLIKRLEDLQIHSGEASIIALGKEMQDKTEEIIVIIDDLTVREIARTLELKITGTLGIILKALHQRLITKKECKYFLQFLIENTTFRISTNIFSKILKEIEKINDRK